MSTRVNGWLQIVTRCDCPDHHSGEHHNRERVNIIVPMDLDGTSVTRNEILRTAAGLRIAGRHIDGWSWDETVEVTRVGEDQLLRQLGAPTLFEDLDL